jgi:hypothetical protein
LAETVVAEVSGVILARRDAVATEAVKSAWLACIFQETSMKTSSSPSPRRSAMSKSACARPARPDRARVSNIKEEGKPIGRGSAP